MKQHCGDCNLLVMPQCADEGYVDTVLLREWGETSYRVTVTPEGRFELGGKVFKSLSAASRHITGTNWSGPRFFGLVQDSRRVR